ncbi:MAG: hypothetical protein ACI8O8_002029 [Oleiphilaceae bacterium]|jgi:hypothetical protein
MLRSLRDLAPVILVILFFQFAVLQQTLPNLVDIIIGIIKKPHEYDEYGIVMLSDIAKKS